MGLGMPRYAVQMLALAAIAFFGLEAADASLHPSSADIDAVQAVQPAGEQYPEGYKGNRTIPDFRTAKRILRDSVWNAEADSTIYCRAKWNADWKVSAYEDGFVPDEGAFRDRAGRIEWEHSVPAEHFGRAFTEWRVGGKKCFRRGKPFRGRKCAETNPLFAKAEADLYNLFPSIGAVNAMRGNIPYGEADRGGNIVQFGNCPMKIDRKHRLAEPPDHSKGTVARASLYMDYAYPFFSLRPSQKRLMEKWNIKFPPDAAECARGELIERIQGNENPILKNACKGAEETK